MALDGIVGATGYNVYRGNIGSFASASYDHNQVAGWCGLAAPNVTDLGVCGDNGDYYYLVTGGCVGGGEGTYGLASDGTPRPLATAPCP